MPLRAASSLQELLQKTALFDLGKVGPRIQPNLRRGKGLPDVCTTDRCVSRTMCRRACRRSLPLSNCERDRKDDYRVVQRIAEKGAGKTSTNSGERKTRLSYRPDR